jgi:hypothetical protein
MTGEMSREEVTRENFPLYFAAADMVEGATVAVRSYQGPYIHVPGKGRYFLWRKSIGTASGTTKLAKL